MEKVDKEIVLTTTELWKIGTTLGNLANLLEMNLLSLEGVASIQERPYKEQQLEEYHRLTRELIQYMTERMHPLSAILQNSDDRKEVEAYLKEMTLGGGV